MGHHVSALIPCYEMAHCVANAVRSVLEQEGDPVEVIVVDDGSKVGPDAALAEFGDRVRLVRQENGGAAAARNRAASEATGTWLAFLDADDRWVPEKTRLTLAALGARPKARFAYGQALGIGERGERKILGAPRADLPMDGDILLTVLRTGNHVPMTTGVVHRDAFFAVGGLDESLRSGEDYDLWIRLAERYTAAYVAEPLCLYRMHAGGDVMGDLERWVRSCDEIHSRLLARHPGDDAIADAVDLTHATVRLSRGHDRLQLGQREAAREDLLIAAKRPETRATARKLLAYTHLPTAVYRSIRKARQAMASAQARNQTG